MIIAISIAVALVVACISYYALFKDFDDFCEGLGRFFSSERGGMWRAWAQDADGGQSWASGIRFKFFALSAIGSGFFAYYELHKHFG